MHNVRLPRAIVLTALMLASTACAGDGAGPDVEQRPTEALNFLRQAADAPPLANPVVQFYAKRGTDRAVFIYYRPRAGETDSLEFVHFRVPAEALLRRPDGTLIQQGDSVLVTMRVVDPSRLVLEFEPTGLRFSSTKPAELEISFMEADDDLDRDGDTDDRDRQLEQTLGLWRQEAAGQPWYKLASVIEFEIDEVDARLTGFSGYAIAF